MSSLRPGARVGVVAPGGAVDPARLEPGLALLRAWGLEPVPGPHLLARQRWFAGSAVERAADLTWALSAPDLDAAWFARGGSGTGELLGELPWARLAPDRPVIGFSDATALFAALAGRGRRAIHGPVLTTLAEASEDSQASLRQLLFGGRAAPLPGRQLAGPAQTVTGPVLGGNLTVLASLCGTPWAPRAAGAILLLEDVDEAPYRLVRALGQLLAAGVLAGVRGVGLGELLRCGEPGQAEEALAERLAPLGVPIVGGLPLGHGPRNLAFPHGAPGRLGALGLDWGDAPSLAPKTPGAVPSPG